MTLGSINGQIVTTWALLSISKSFPLRKNRKTHPKEHYSNGAHSSAWFAWKRLFALRSPSLLEKTADPSEKWSSSSGTVRHCQSHVARPANGYLLHRDVAQKNDSEKFFFRKTRKISTTYPNPPEMQKTYKWLAQHFCKPIQIRRRGKKEPQSSVTVKKKQLFFYYLC